MVFAYDEETGKSDWKPVVRLFRNESDLRTTLSIKADDGTIDEIISTPGHKYYLPDNKINRNANERLEHASYEGLSDKWVSACDLKKGDKVLLSDGKYGIVIKVKTEQCEKFTTYNFEVADFHTYYVGENSVLVHNAGGPCDGGLKFANKGSTGRTDPNNLYEQLAMKQVQSNPLAGSEHLSKITMGDSRWLASDGWLKMQNVVTSSVSKTTIHFVYNPALSLVDDFKFVAFMFL